MIARLVLLTGSQAGIEAPLQQGYYMIGRHKECQIRPKSRSVSRRHCVLHFHDKELLAMDLASTSGSKRNADRFEPKKWIRLEDGDTLKLGKVQFRVCLESVVDDATPASDAKPPADGDAWNGDDHEVPDQARSSSLEEPLTNGERSAKSSVVKTSVADAASSGSASSAEDGARQNGATSKRPTPATPPQRPGKQQDKQPAARVGEQPTKRVSERASKQPSLVSGAAWETFDVATFLHDEDNVDREERYDQIRSKNLAAQKAAEREWLDHEGGGDDDSGDGMMDPFDDDSVFDDTLYEGESGSISGSDLPNSNADGKANVETKSKSAARSRPTPLPPRKREFSLPGWLRPRGDADSWKLIAAVVLTLAVLGLSGWKLFQFVQGPEVRVLRELN